MWQLIASFEDKIQLAPVDDIPFFIQWIIFISES